jgi:hypothetical protein
LIWFGVEIALLLVVVNARRDRRAPAKSSFSWPSRTTLEQQKKVLKRFKTPLAPFELAQIVL